MVQKNKSTTTARLIDAHEIKLHYPPNGNHV
jgi:hypothetical protein